MPEANNVAPIELKKDKTSRFLNLKQNQVCDKVILVGDPGRVHRVSQNLDDVDFEMNQREFITHKGKYKGEDVMVISTGMGADNLEIVMVELDSLLNYDFKNNRQQKEFKELTIIRLASSGGIQDSIQPGDTVLNKNAISLGTLMNFYQWDLTLEEQELAKAFNKELAIDWKVYAVAGSPSLYEKCKGLFTEGNVLTCPGYYAPMGRPTRVLPRYQDFLDKVIRFHFNDNWITHMDMETSAFYGMARVLKHQAICITNITNNRQTGKRVRDVNKAYDKVAKSVLEILVN